MLVADGLGFCLCSDCVVKPAARIFTASLARERHAPFAETLLQFGFFHSRQIADFLNAERVQIAFHHFAYAGNFADVKRRQKLHFFSRNYPKHSVGLRLSRGYFCDQP